MFLCPGVQQMRGTNRSEDQSVGGETGRALPIPHTCQAVDGQWLHSSPRDHSIC